MNSFVESARVTSKWQITIPKDVREQMGISIGDRVSFLVDGNKIILVTSLKAALEIVQDSMKGIADELGVKNDDDVQKLVNEVRYGK